MTDLQEYGPFSLRIALGLLFLLPGISKLMTLFSTGTHMVVGLLWGVTALVWLLAIVEVLGGLALLAGFQTKYAVWPLVIIMVGAIVTVILPSNDPMMIVNLLFHILAIGGLVSIFFTGPGALAVKQ